MWLLILVSIIIIIAVTLQSCIIIAQDKELHRMYELFRRRKHDGI